MYDNFYDPESLDELTTDEMIEEIINIFGHEANETIQFCNICEKYDSDCIKYAFRYFIRGN